MSTSQTVDKLDKIEFNYSLFSFTMIIEKKRYFEVTDYDDKKQSY